MDSRRRRARDTGGGVVTDTRLRFEALSAAHLAGDSPVRGPGRRSTTGGMADAVGAVVGLRRVLAAAEAVG
jgi:hypothetical protein